MHPRLRSVVDSRCRQTAKRIELIKHVPFSVDASFVFVSVDFSTSDYNMRVKIQVSTQNKTQFIELETDTWVVLLKVGFIPLKGEITLIDGIFQKIDVKIGRIRLWTGKELDSSGYTLLNRLFLVVGTGISEFRAWIISDGSLLEFSSYHEDERRLYKQMLDIKDKI